MHTRQVNGQADQEGGVRGKYTGAEMMHRVQVPKATLA